MKIRGIRFEDVREMKAMEDLAVVEDDWRDALLQPELARYLEVDCRAIVDANDKAVVLIGGTCPRAGVLHIWALYDESTPQHGVGVVRTLRRMRDYMVASGFYRLESYVDAQWPVARDHMRMMGFEEEGVKRSYFAPGRDAIVMALVNV
jgi:hypothetical protein